MLKSVRSESSRRPTETDARAAAACLFNGFSDPHRVAILQYLALGEQRVVDLTAHLGLAQSTVSKHLSCLRDCGMVSVRPQGRASVYRLSHAEELMSLWVAVERLLAVTGDRVALCESYGAATLPTDELGA